MKHLLLVIYCGMVYCLNAQTDTTMFEFIRKVSFQFDETKQEYLQTSDELKKGKAYLTEVSIWTNEKEKDNTWEILGLHESDPKDDRIYYRVLPGGDALVIALSPDSVYLTVIGDKNKYIYVLDPDKTQIIKANPEKDVVFNYYLLDQKPLFIGTKTTEESELMLDEFIAQKVSALSITGKGYYTIYINSEGTVFKVNVERSGGKTFDIECIAVLEELPEFSTPIKNENAVSTAYTLKIEQ